MMMSVKKIKLGAKFKVDLTDADEATISEIRHLFAEYRRIVNELIEYAHSHRITSPRRLWYAKYRELRQRYPTLPSHYIYTACRYASSIYKSFVEMKKLGMCEKEKPVFKRWAIWLDKQLFKLDIEGSIANPCLNSSTLEEVAGSNDALASLKPLDEIIVTIDDNILVNVNGNNLGIRAYLRQYNGLAKDNIQVKVAIILQH
jgi:hypothetical protein